MPRSLSLVVAACLACAGIAPGASAADGPAYGPRLEGFDYPWPVHVFDFTSQKQAMQMAYLDVAPTGTPTGRVAVLLHGKNFCAATWEDTIRALSAAGWRVVAPDQIGFCKSTKPAQYQYTLAGLAADTHALLQSLGIGNIDLVGHSMGGMLSIRYALMYPGTIDRLALIGPLGLEDWRVATSAKLDGWRVSTSPRTGLAHAAKPAQASAARATTLPHASARAPAG